MADPKDVEANKAARREFSKRPIDTSRADIRVAHGVVYVRGQLSPMRGSDSSVKEMLDQISKVMRSKPGIRDFVIDAVVRE